MSSQFILTLLYFSILLFVSATDVFSQTPRTPDQIRADTERRNRALENYDRQNPNRIVARERFVIGGKIPSSEIRSYVLAAQAETEVRIVSVESGDTLLVDDGVRNVTVSVLGIDAPENGQAFYEEAKKNLIESLVGKKVLLKYSLHNLKNEFGYFPARVFVGETDIGLSALKNGFAWRNEKDKYFFEKKTDKENELAETEARAAKIGIWSEVKPQMPWKYREQKGKEEMKIKKKTDKN